MKSLICLSILFVSFFSHGGNSAPVSQPELLEDSVSTQELLLDTTADSSLLNSSSLLSIKGSGVILRNVTRYIDFVDRKKKFIEEVEFVPAGFIGLEYQDSWQKKGQLKWIISGGALFNKRSFTENLSWKFLFPVDAGLRYVFQSKPVTLSFKIGTIDIRTFTVSYGV